MITIVFLILFCVMGFRVALGVYRNSTIFREFDQSRALGALALLYPLGPLALMISPARFGWLPPFILAAACYIPALVVAKRVGQAFDRAGTDRVKAALTTVSQASISAMVGLLYVTGVLVVLIASLAIAT